MDATTTTAGRWPELEVPAERAGPPLAETLPLAELVVESATFTAAERAEQRVVGRYHLRAGGAPFLLRHRTPDVGVLGEVFAERLYELPDDVPLPLPRAPRVLDAGGNIGLFGLFARVALGAAHVTSFEPDRFNLMLLRRTAAANGQWDVVGAAVAAEAGELVFEAGQFACSRAERRMPGEPLGSDAFETATERVPAVDLFAHLAGVDLLKLDVEGGEWPLLADPRLSTLGPALVVLEYHPYGAPVPDARRAAHAALRRAGYATREIVHRASDGVGMLWAWRAP